MPPPPTQQQRRNKSAVALTLTLVAGYVDIIGYLSLYHVFTAHMTGTTVHVGHSLANRDWPSAATAGAALAGFVIGSIVGRVLIELGGRIRVRAIASVTLALEAALLIAFVLATGSNLPAIRAHGGAAPALLLALLGAAMGLQTATLTRIGPLTVHTTFITGMLNKFAQLVSHVFFDSYDLVRGNRNESELRDRRRKTLGQVAFMFSLWFLYFSGAAIGTWLQSWWHVRALYLAIVILLLALAVDQLSPLSIEEEREQFER